MSEAGDGCWQLPRQEAPKPILLVAAVALVDSDGRVLIAKRPEGKSMAGLWEFPGGKVKDDETPEMALVRELAEEIDIDTKTSCFAPFTFSSYLYDDFHLLMPLYLCRIWQGIPQAQEGQTLKWAYPNRLAIFTCHPRTSHSWRCCEIFFSLVGT